MGRPREELDDILRDILGSQYVYFQPPSTIKMKYPCIRYEQSRFDNKHADNAVYKTNIQYTVTVIYLDPDSDLPDKVNKIPTAKHNTHYIAENLYHDVFSIYF